MRKHLLLGLCFGMIGAVSPALADISCNGLSLNDCRDLIDANKIAGGDAGTILRAAAQSHLDHANPDEAILFLTIAESRDPNSALTQKLWGDAYVMRGERLPLTSGELGKMEIEMEFIEAMRKYMAGLGIDPDSAENFRGAVLASTRTGNCDFPRIIQVTYAGPFEGTPDAELLENFLDEKC